MTGLHQLLSSELAYRLGWALLHSLWQGAAVALGFGLILLAIPRTKSNARYLTGCISMLVIVAICVFTFVRIKPQERQAPVPSAFASPGIPIAPEGSVAINPDHESISSSAATLGPVLHDAPSGNNHPSTALSPPWRDRIHDLARSKLTPLLPMLAGLWLLGVCTLSLWRFGGLLATYRLRRIGTAPVSHEVRALVTRLSQRLRVSRPVQVLQSAVLGTPAVIGHIRPVILLPLSALIGLSPEELEAILAHELAHIRRHDYIANVLQSVVETLLFHHPAVWWISHRVRAERENCCDDLAVDVCGDRLIYARALTQVQQLDPGGVGLAVAASGGSLLARVRRIAGLPNQSETLSSGWVALTLTCALALTIVAGVRMKAVGAAPVKATSLPSDTDDLLERALLAHEASLKAVDTGEGDFVLELHSQTKGPHSFASLNGPDAVAKNLTEGIDPDDGWMHAQGHWWFSGDKYRFDRTPLPLKPSEKMLDPAPRESRSACDGLVDVDAYSDPRSQAPPKRWWADIRDANRYPPAPQRLENRHISPPIDVRWFQEFDLKEPLRVQIDRLEKQGYERQVQEKDGKIQIILTKRDIPRRWEVALDPAVGYMITDGRLETQGKTTIRISNAYRQIDGRWFAQEFSGTSSRSVETTLSYRITLQNVKLGKPIEDRVFTLEGLNLPPGSRTVNVSRRGPQRHFGGSSPDATTKPSDGRVPPSSSRGPAPLMTKPATSDDKPALQIFAPTSGKYGYIDGNGQLAIPPTFDGAKSFSEGLAAVAIGPSHFKAWGYINKSGAFIAKPQFEIAESFSEGLACVESEGKYGYLDTNGLLAIPLQYSGAWSFSEGLGLVKEDGRWVYIDRTGKVVITTQSDLAYPTCSFKEGLALTRSGEKWGYIDKTGQMVIQAQFERGSKFQEGLAPVRTGGKWGYIDKSGRMVLPARFDSALPFKDGYAVVSLGGKITSHWISGEPIFNGGWGLIDKSGRFALDPKFYKLENVSEGLAVFGDHVNDRVKYGYVNLKGEVVIPAQFDKAGEFIGGGAQVLRRSSDGKMNSFDCIDRTGHSIIKAAGKPGARPATQPAPSDVAATQPVPQSKGQPSSAAPRDALAVDKAKVEEVARKLEQHFQERAMALAPLGTTIYPPSNRAVTVIYSPAASQPENTATQPARGQGDDWLVEGFIRDDQGRPIEGATVNVRTGQDAVLCGGAGVTNASGKFQVRFGPSVDLLGKKRGDFEGLQAAIVSVQKDGWYEKQLCRGGDLFIASKTTKPEAQWVVSNGRTSKIIPAGKPHHLDFTLLPAAKLQKRLVDPKGQAVPNRRLWIAGRDLPPALSVLTSLDTDADGRFMVDSFPCCPSWWFTANGTAERSEEKVETEPFNVREPRAYEVELMLTDMPDRSLRLRRTELRRLPSTQPVSNSPTQPASAIDERLRIKKILDTPLPGNKPHSKLQIRGSLVVHAQDGQLHLGLDGVESIMDVADGEVRLTQDGSEKRTVLKVPCLELELPAPDGKKQTLIFDTLQGRLRITDSLGRKLLEVRGRRVALLDGKSEMEFDHLELNTNLPASQPAAAIQPRPAVAQEIAAEMQENLNEETRLETQLDAILKKKQRLLARLAGSGASLPAYRGPGGGDNPQTMCCPRDGRLGERHRPQAA